MGPPNRYAAMQDKQRGAIGLMAALTLGLALLCTLVVVDSGRLYMEKRSLQRVADIAALEAAGRKGTCATAASAATFANESAARNGFVVGSDGRLLTTHCGTLTVGAQSQRVFTANATQSQAIQVVASHPVPRSFAAGIGALFSSAPASPNILLSATAVAMSTPPVAALTIRSAALTVDSATASILNPIVGGMLGGALNLSVANWQGLASTDLSLLSYLNRLKTDLNLTAVGYTQVLAATVSVSQLIQSAVNVLDPGGTLSGQTYIAGLQAVKAATGATTVVLGDLLAIQGSSDIAQLNTNLRLIDLVQGLAQLANDKNGISAATQINLPGLAQVTARIQVIEPPQLSAIGDPSQIDPTNPANGPNRIYVRTAQMRALVSINLPLLDAIAPLVSTAGSVIGSLTPVLNTALNLNIAGVLGSTTCALGLTSCMVTDVKLLPSATSSSAGPKIDLSLSLASADSYVTGYTCTSNTNKTLTVHTDSALVTIRAGQVSDPFPASTAPTAVTAIPLPVIDIGTMTCQKILGVLGSCSTRTAFGGGGIGLTFDPVNQSPLGNSVSTSSTFSSPNLPEISSPAKFQNQVASVKPSSALDGVFSSVRVSAYKPASSTALGNVIASAASFLGTLTLELDKVVDATLKPLLTSVIDPLLAALGVSLAPADVGANLSCNYGQATLVI